MKLIDYHIHCNYSEDNSNRIRDIIKKTSEENFYDACIVAHFEPHTFNKKGKFRFNSILPKKFDDYFKEVEKYNKEFSQNVKIGLEVTYEKEFEKEIETYLKERQFDFILGACHDINGNSIFADPKLVFGNKNPEDIARIYFSKVKDMINSKLFDSIAHIDMIRKTAGDYYGEVPFEMYKPYLKDVVSALVKNKVCFELNTNPYNLKPGQTALYPSIETMKLFYEKGARLVTIGSDAHDCKRVGDKMDFAMKTLNELGFKTITQFNKRKPKQVAISELN